ncbi:MAG TPA: tetratricopeptide repeat protein [Thermoanaerobaculia bacterium]|nr:tetratricopeptide repeat protein [Thermoanaerobaculia bacterium]
MKLIRYPALAVLALALAGCLTPRPPSMTPSSVAEVIEGVPLERWGDNTCGAGALAAVLRFHGSKATEAELVPRLPRGRNDGVVSVDLLLAAREHGLEAEMVRGDRALLAATIQGGVPAILMLRVADLPGERRDLYHYVVADGYDEVRGIFRMHFGDGSARWVSLDPIGGPTLDNLERAWKGAGYAMLVVTGSAVMPADALPTGIRRAVYLEEEGRLDEAAALYRLLLDESPQSALAWTNLGNVETRRERMEAAEHAYREALARDPDDRDALNNLASLLLRDNRALEEAETLARRAALQEGPDHYLYTDTWARALTARGQCLEAIPLFDNVIASLPAGAGDHLPDLLVGRARAHLECGRKNEARRDLRTATSFPLDPDLRANAESLLALIE